MFLCFPQIMTKPKWEVADPRDTMRGRCFVGVCMEKLWTGE